MLAWVSTGFRRIILSLQLTHFTLNHSFRFQFKRQPFLQTANSATNDSTAWQAANSNYQYRPNSVRNNIFPNIQSKSFLELPRLMGPFSVFTVFVGVISCFWCGRLDKTRSSFSAHGKIGNFIIINRTVSGQWPFPSTTSIKFEKEFRINIVLSVNNLKSFY